MSNMPLYHVYTFDAAEANHLGKGPAWSYRDWVKVRIGQELQRLLKYRAFVKHGLHVADARVQIRRSQHLLAKLWGVHHG